MTLFEKFIKSREMEEKSKEFVTLDNYPRYEISVTIPHVIREKLSKKLISQSINNVGYYQITLNGETKLMHRIICEQFNKTRLDTSEMDVNHINHDKLDNRPENLEWINHSSNLSKRDSFKKQKYEYVDEIDDENCVLIKTLDYNKLNGRYY